jgi:hypothetical protein
MSPRPLVSFGCLAALALVLAACGGPPPAKASSTSAGDSAVAKSSPEVQDWWRHMKVLAADDMRGRQTGSPEHRRAAEYVAERFKSLGLEPGVAGGGYLQPVSFVSRRIKEPQCSLWLVFPDHSQKLVLGKDATLSMRCESAADLDLPIVFDGYGITVPDQGYDDPAAIDLKGKLALSIGGGPKSVTEPRRSTAQASGERWAGLRRARAVGSASIQNPHHSDATWERAVRNRFGPSMSLADTTLDEMAGMRISVNVNPDSAQKWFEGSGHTFAELLALADSAEALPRFPLVAQLKAKVRYDREVVESQNVVAVLPGKDPRRANEAVVLTAHLDHLGVGAPANGDSIYNGAMDNASGVSVLLEVAKALTAPERRPARSVIFVCVTGEEKGLLGSHYYANRPAVTADSMIANINVDMVLPIVPLDHMLIHGVDESTLGDRARELAVESGITLLPDPEPERRLFVRSDQFNFIRNGVPAIAPDAAAPKGSANYDKLRAWIKTRYHQPGDDLAQPFDPAAVGSLISYVTELAARVANDPTRPVWKPTSFFRRYAAPTP